MATVRIEDRFSVTEFDGELIAQATTRIPDGIRWVEFRLYRLDSDGYLLHRLGASRVYHQADTGCHTTSGQPSGEPGKARDLPAGAYSCDRCQPEYPENLEPDAAVRIEYTRHTIDRCDTADQVVRRLTNMRSRGSRVQTQVVSEPVKELLALAAGADPEFAMAEKPVERIN